MGTTSTEMKVFRRSLLAAAGAWLLSRAAGAATSSPAIEVWKDPSCGCCEAWVSHLKANKFAVIVHGSGHEAMRRRLGIDPKYGSCHTGVVGGYAIEGHVPAREIRRLLAQRPAAVGLAVPGMPMGSPGMDGPEYEGRQDPFDVLLLSAGGGSTVFQRYQGRKS